MSKLPKQTGGASASQKGKAAEMRYEVEDEQLRNDLHEIVHSGDKKGPHATRPNKFRDLDNKSDPKAAAAIKAAKKSIAKK